MIIKKCGGTNHFATKERTKYEKKGIPLEDYKEDKIKILKRDFKLKLTDDQIKHINSLESEIQVDRYARFCLDNSTMYATRR